MKLKTLFNFAVVGMVVLLLLASGLFNLDSISAQSISASLSPTAGLVQFRTRGNTQWTTVTQVQSIVAGDQIRTGSNGLAVLTTPNGIELTIYPSVLIQLTSLGTAANGGQQLVVYQLAGTIFSNVPKKGSRDRVQIFLPPAGITVRGTQFITQVAPGIGGGIIGRESTVDVTSADLKRYIVAPLSLAYGHINADQLANVGVNRDTLRANATSSFNSITGLRGFLKDMLIMYDVPETHAFLTDLLGIPATSTNDEINAAIDASKLTNLIGGERLAGLSRSGLNLRTTLSRLLDFWLNTYKATLTAPIAAATCGNLTQDAGETFENCPDDFADLSTCGNGYCEEFVKGESVITCTADCIPQPNVALQAAQQNDLNSQVPVIPIRTRTPVASGVGR
ncbi:MAG: FecR domain-containing protein [Anaerolineae bacterium]|nr:FecR domain-containing protein [Anaerolineae bacterium]